MDGMPPAGWHLTNGKRRSPRRHSATPPRGKQLELQQCLVTVDHRLWLTERENIY